MGCCKNLVTNILEDLRLTNMDYEWVGKKYGMTPTEVYELAKQYGDVE